MEQNNRKAWLYLLPAMAFLGVFLVYPLVDVLVYKKKVIGGAVYTAAVDGFMQGLTPLNAQTEG